MGSVSVACYKRGPGCEKELLELVRNHPQPLRDLGLVTERLPIAMRGSTEAIEGAHKIPAVLELSKRFEAACWYETPSNLAEFQKMFAHLSPI